MTAAPATAASSKALIMLATRYAHGDETVLFEITPAVYQELKRVARNDLRHERAGHTLQASAIVNEV